MKNQKTEPKVKCFGGKRCVRGMQDQHTGEIRYERISRRGNSLCTCWRRPLN